MPIKPQLLKIFALFCGQDDPHTPYPMFWYKQLHWQIILGMVMGALYGVFAASQGWGEFTQNWISPFGEIFLNLLKLIAMPLVLTSLICGVASLSDFKKLSRMGSKTIGLYLATTAIAVTIGLCVVNTINPGDKLPKETVANLKAEYETDVAKRSEIADSAKERGPLQPLVDMVPDNFFGSASSNRNMLQIVFFSLLMGVALIQIQENKRKPVFDVISGL